MISFSHSFLLKASLYLLIFKFVVSQKRKGTGHVYYLVCREINLKIFGTQFFEGLLRYMYNGYKFCIRSFSPFISTAKN